MNQIKYLTITAKHYEIEHQPIHDDISKVSIYVDPDCVEQLMNYVKLHGDYKLKRFCKIADFEALDFFFEKLHYKKYLLLTTYDHNVMKPTADTTKELFYITFDLENQVITIENDDEYRKEYE